MCVLLYGYKQGLDHFAWPIMPMSSGNHQNMCIRVETCLSFDFIVIYMQSMNAFLALTNLCRPTFLFSLLLIAVVDIIVELLS